MTSVSLSALDPTLIDGVRDQLAKDFAQRIFDTVPDISECIDFEADACTSAAGKKRFERASQLLYSQRRELQTQIAAVVQRIFDEKLFRLLDSAGRGRRQSLAGITLLPDERLDEEIAINHCSRRLKEQCDHELWSLTQRITVMTGINHPTDSQNPVFPQTFAQALMEAISALETNTEVRLAVFKTFGPVLLEIVPAVFTAANSSLKARGIDIESEDYYGRPILTPERQTVPAAIQQDIAAKVDLELTGALRQILSNATRGEPTAAVQQDQAARQKSLTTALQLPVFEAVATNEPVWLDDLRDIEAGSAEAGSNQVGRTLHAARHALHEKLTRDEQVIGDIITVMFDRLLADARMPIQLRAIVARLQIPVLELALSDRSLLTQVNHPVRRLVDLIAEFGLTLGLDDDDDTTVRSVESIIDGLALIHRELPNAFQVAFDRLDSFYYHHEEAALQIDANLRALERREAVAFAGSQADREIALRLQYRTLPKTISNFILTAWREVLTHDYLHGGPMGLPWKLGLATLDDVVKSLHPATDNSERRRLAKVLPASIELLLNRPDTAGDHGLLAADFFAEMQRAHELAIAGNWADIGGDLQVPSPVALAVPPNIASPSAALSALGLACGDWIETRDEAGIRRWRLNWITSIFGTCVFKHYESGSICNVGCDELRERIASGSVQRVRGLGLADEVLKDAFATVSRKARREEAILATPAVSSFDTSISPENVNAATDYSAPSIPSFPS